MVSDTEPFFTQVYQNLAKAQISINFKLRNVNKEYSLVSLLVLKDKSFALLSSGG